VLTTLIFSSEAKIFQVGSDANLSIAWKYDDKVISPKCIPTIWENSYNYKVTAEKNNISNQEDFFDNPGKYFGKTIVSFDPIDPGWGSGEKISITPNLQECFSSNNTFNIDNEYSVIEVDISYYKVIKNISIDVCRKLAPHMQGECVSSKLIVALNPPEYNPRDSTEDIFIMGIFQLNNGQEYILPLKRFLSESDALSYID
jgi:hypothetical protein